MRAHWRNLANTIERVLPSAHCFLRPTGVHNPNGKSIGSAVFAQVTVECSYTLQWAAPSPSKLLLRMGDLDAHLNHGSWAHPSPQPKRHLDRFSRFCMAHECDRPTDRPTDRQITLLGR